MHIEKAIQNDLEACYFITKNCAATMIKNGIFQWNEAYPSKDALYRDIELQQLWKLTDNNIIIGIIVLTKIEDIEYKSVKWLTKNKHNLYVHRLAVDPKFQGKGYAQKLMRFSEDYALKKGFHSIRLDTFSQNTRNQKFYKKQGYIKLEEIYFPNQSEFPFYCYEKILNVQRI
ncbi:GNAT family N-acetyltransferase [Lutibacter sp. A64]|uniref:GNAT family N-acetyltransferase n=1 Tax=Lutibacter sp. A64 TaxID=2918526 RepID=UPI001F06E6E2|nr:GNAT family N-acetyltransferase [Lutibacter sp. A64]UMB52974.1 GNAT family N-acetyltransferase [Lutibacter sp. A64]